MQFERQFAPVVDQRNTKRISSVLELLDVKKRIVEVNDLHALPGVLKSTIHYEAKTERTSKRQRRVAFKQAGNGLKGKSIAHG